MRSSTNPVFNKVNNLSQSVDEVARENEGGRIVIENATYLGLGLKILYFLGITIASGFGGILLMAYFPQAFIAFLMVSVFTGFISAIVAMNSFKLAFFFGTLYCIGEGMFLGVISMIANEFIPGIVFAVVAATLSVVVVCGLLFATRIVKVTRTFNRFLITFMFGFLISLLMIMVLSWLGFINPDNIWLSLGVSAISLIIASFVLISDMERAKQLVDAGGPKQAEWMLAFGISYTVLWIYIELLRLAIIIFGNRN